MASLPSNVSINPIGIPNDTVWIVDVSIPPVLIQLLEEEFNNRAQNVVKCLNKAIDNYNKQSIGRIHRVAVPAPASPIVRPIQHSWTTASMMMQKSTHDLEYQLGRLKLEIDNNWPLVLKIQVFGQNTADVHKLLSLNNGHFTLIGSIDMDEDHIVEEIIITNVVPKIK